MARSVDIYDLEGNVKGKVGLPDAFLGSYRLDIIARAVVALESRHFQPKARDPMAGKRTTAESFGVGRGLSRVPRVKGERHPRASQAAIAPGTVGGRVTHPPRSQKRIRKEINRKELRLALSSALSACSRKDMVEKRGHSVTKLPSIPLIVTDEIQRVTKTSEAKKVFRNLGLWEDLERVMRKTPSRSRRARLRGRSRRVPKGPLIIIGQDEGLRSACANLPGVDVAVARNLSVESLAPGGHAGRLTVWSESAIRAIQERV